MGSLMCLGPNLLPLLAVMGKTALPKVPAKEGYACYISQSLTALVGASKLTFSSAEYLNFSTYTQHSVMNTSVKK